MLSLSHRSCCAFFVGPLFLVACAASDPRTQTASPFGLCDSTGHAAIADTTGMTKKEFMPQNPSLEGAAGYALLKADTARILNLTFFRETGKTEDRYQIIDTSNFIIRRIETAYTAPINI